MHPEEISGGATVGLLAILIQVTATYLIVPEFTVLVFICGLIGLAAAFAFKWKE